MKKLGLLLVITLFVMSAFSQLKYPKVPKSTNDATIKGKLEYPHHFKYEGNPLSRMHSAADPFGSCLGWRSVGNHLARP